MAELGIVFLLFFLGLEFTLGRLARSRRHALVGGSIDFVVNAGLGLAVGVAAFGLHFGALILAGAIYVSSSAITVKGLIDFRRLADDETDLVLAILVAEDLVIALDPRLRGRRRRRARLDARARRQGARLHHALARGVEVAQPARSTGCCSGCRASSSCSAAFAFLVGMAAVAEELGLSEAIGALMAGVVLSETSVREELEERFFSFRDVFAALFFFVFGLSIDVGAIGEVGWLLAAAVAVTLVGKIGGGFAAGVSGGYTRRQSLNAGVALVAHGEFTIILAQIASTNDQLSPHVQKQLVAFSGLYVLATAMIGVVLMKESKALGRRLFPPA